MHLTKKMIACVAIVIALFAFAPSSYAQPRMDTAAMRQREEAMMEKLTTELKLTPVQVDSLRAISHDIGTKRREIFMDQSISREDKMDKMAPLTEAANKRIEAALGPDLFKKYKDWMEQNRPQRGGGGGRGN